MVELIEIINKPLLLHLVGYLYYWQMGFNSVFKGLMRVDLTLEFNCPYFFGPLAKKIEKRPLASSRLSAHR